MPTIEQDQRLANVVVRPAARVLLVQVPTLPPSAGRALEGSSQILVAYVVSIRATRTQTVMAATTAI